MVPGGRSGGGDAAAQFINAQQCASAAAAEILISTPGSSKARQKKFHRHFKTVAADEKVLNCKISFLLLLNRILFNLFCFINFACKKFCKSQKDLQIANPQLMNEIYQ